MDYSMAELNEWDKKIEKLLIKEGIDYYPQVFEICTYEDMLCYEAYTGMPSHYPHWSFGKAYERQKTFYKYNLTGLPYELVINSNPCMAYLMKENTLLLQILTIAHVYGHNNFFKNNRLFKEGTMAQYTTEMFKNHADRIRSYISDPSIGYEKVERILDAAHSLRYQTCRVIGEKRLTHEELRQRMLEKINKPKDEHWTLSEQKEEEIPNLNRIPLEPEEDMLSFIIEYGELEEWEKDILHIVIEETKYFLPQIETKIMNEGWASFCHYRILNALELPQNLHIEFLKRHNLVVRPFMGHINPYFLGFKIFEDISKRYPGNEKLFEIRDVERDQSFIKRYLTFEICKELNLFEYAKRNGDFIVTEVSDEHGWEAVRDTLVNETGVSRIPVIRVVDMCKMSNFLILEHLFDGRELDLNYANETLKQLGNLWNGKIMLKTVIGGSKKVIVCDENRKISI